jgi:hypothetical protein
VTRSTDRLLIGAVENLVQNALEFTPCGGHVCRNLPGKGCVFTVDLGKSGAETSGEARRESRAR